MVELLWDQDGERLYETGVDKVVLYIPNNLGVYAAGYAWNGVTAITASPSGAEATKSYADNRVYANVVSVEEFGATLEAFTYPDEFEACQGAVSPVPGLTISQQNRQTFGLSYRSLIGNDLVGTDFGYKINLVYGALAAPSEKANNTVNESTELMAMSWELTTTPIEIPGFRPSAKLTIDSTTLEPAKLAEIEDLLYGTSAGTATLPKPSAILALLDA
jgi:hypothetical protein